MPSATSSSLAAVKVVLLAVAALLASASAAVASPHTDSSQTAYFPGVEPFSAYSATFRVTHFEDDPFPYTLGSSAFSNSTGTAVANAALDTLGAFYHGDQGPVYEVNVCLYPAISASAVKRTVAAMNLLSYQGRLATNPLRMPQLLLPVAPVNAALAGRIERLGATLTATAIACTDDTYVGWIPESDPWPYP